MKRGLERERGSWPRWTVWSNFLSRVRGGRWEEDDWRVWVDGSDAGDRRASSAIRFSVVNQTQIDEVLKIFRMFPQHHFLLLYLIHTASVCKLQYVVCTWPYFEWIIWFLEKKQSWERSWCDSQEPNSGDFRTTESKVHLLTSTTVVAW